MDKAFRHRIVDSGFLGLMIFALVVGAVRPGHAQTTIPRDVDRAQLARSQRPPVSGTSPDTATTDEEIAASPNDPDLGEQAILKRSERYLPFSFFAAAPISYTSNVALASSNEEYDFLFTPSFGLTYAPRLARATLRGHQRGTAVLLL